MITSKYDPSKIFEHASHFHESYKRLGKTVSPDRPEEISSIAHPAMILSVFASELYLKCLLHIEQGVAPNTHNLKKLFISLQATTRRRLEDLWDADIRRPGRQEVIERIRKLPKGADLRLDLPFVLNIGAEAFIELRYYYEKRDTYFLLYEFPTLLRKVIVEQFPKWDGATVSFGVD